MPQDAKEDIWPGVEQFTGPIYERCFLELIDSDTDHWGFRFVIQTEQPEGGSVILSVSVELRPDSQFKDFVSSHVQWRKDPRPLILFCIQDLFWKLKIIEVDNEHPFTLSGAIKDTRSTAILNCRLFATRSASDNASTLIMLVNYANTHVYDQLEKVYEVNPQARLTPARVNLVKERFYEELRRKKQLNCTAQKHRSQLWKRTGKTIHYFVDESGDIGFRNTATHYISVACGVEQDNLRPLRTALREIIERSWGHTKPSELHFRKIPEGKRAEVLSLVSDCFKRFDAHALCYIMLKRGLLKYALRCEAETRREEEHPIISNLQKLLRDSSANPQSYFLSSCVEEVVTFLGGQCLINGHAFTISHDRKHKTWMNDALWEGFERGREAINLISQDFFGSVLKTDSQFKLSDSTQEPCLWIADWIAWEISRWLTNDELSIGLQTSYDAIQLICFDDETGQRLRIDKLGGKVIAELPDWPRHLPKAGVI